MKKIMKKALSLALALVMVFTLAPMTAMAAGTGTESDPIEVSATQTITSDGTGQSVYYVYNAPVAADYEILVTGETDSFGNAMIHPMTGMPFENYAMNGELYLYAYGTDEVAFSLFDYESQALTITITMIEGTEVEGGEGDEATGESADDAIALTENPAYVTLPGGGSMVYYKASVDANAGYTLSLYNRTGADFDLYLYNPRMGSYGWYGSADNGVLEAMISTDSTEYIFAIGNPGDLEVAVQVTLTKEGGEDEGDQEEEQGGTLGTTAAPDTLVMNEEMTTSLDGTGTYWYKWTAAVDGKITVTPGECTAGWTASVFKGADLSEYVGYYDADNNTTFDIIVSADDVVLIGINNPDWAVGTVKFTATFTEGTFEDEDNEDEGSEDVTTFEEVAENAALSPETLQLGEDEYATSLYEYTVYALEPTEIGKYTITAENGLVGIVSYNGMWITIDPSADTVAEDTVVWECTSVGQSVWVAVKTNDDAANINVTREEIVIEEIPEIDYADEVMEADPEKYTFDGEVEDLEMVIYVADKTGAAKDENGFYHLVPAEDLDDEGNYIGTTPIEDCPLILVKLNDSTVSLASAIGYGDVVYVDYDTTVDPIKANYIINFNKAIEKYIAASDTDANLYPLTDDLMAIMLLVGVNNNWYGENGIVAATFENDGIAEGDLITFAMYYMEAAEEAPAPAPIVPGTTGDSSNIALWVAVLGLGVVAIAGSVVMKKREF